MSLLHKPATGPRNVPAFSAPQAPRTARPSYAWSPKAELMRRVAPAHGFTLIEVLVALTIVAVALMAGMKASGALTLHAQRQTDVLLGQMCAENALHQMRLSRQMPGVGQSSRECPQGTQSYTVALDVQPTPNPNFVRVDVLVRNSTEPVLRLTTIVGRN